MNTQEELKKLAEGEEECNEGVEIEVTKKVAPKKKVVPEKAKAKPKAKSKKK